MQYALCEVLNVSRIFDNSPTLPTCHLNRWDPRCVASSGGRRMVKVTKVVMIHRETLEQVASAVLKTARPFCSGMPLQLFHIQMQPGRQRDWSRLSDYHYLVHSSSQKALWSWNSAMGNSPIWWRITMSSQLCSFLERTLPVQKPT